MTSTPFMRLDIMVMIRSLMSLDSGMSETTNKSKTSLTSLIGKVTKTITAFSRSFEQQIIFASLSPAQNRNIAR